MSYIKAGKIPLMIYLLPVFSQNKKEMELFRERVNLSIHASLKRKYFKKKISKSYESKKLIKEKDDRLIWFMWLQGIDNAPEICKANFYYLKNSFGSKVQLITRENVFEYIEIPEFIKNKWALGKITDTHFSDIVRTQLLCTYGGTWVDATVFVNKKFLKSSDKFEIPQTFKPGSNGNALPVSSWFINVPENNQYIKRVRDLLFFYWEKNNRLINYFLLHHFLILASEEMNDYLTTVLPLDNSMPHYLMLLMKRKKLSKNQIIYLLNKSEIQKFTYKMTNDIEKENYETLINIIELWSENES